MNVTKKVIYRIETPRLVLRCWSPHDATQLRQALDKSDKFLRPWIPFMSDEPRSLAATVNWLREIRAGFDRSENFRFGVFTKQGQLVGENMLLRRVGHNALEIGYLTHLGYEKAGYATEATSAMIKIAFEIYQARRLEIHHAGDNPVSGRIPERLGFTHEATLRENMEDTEGNLHDSWIWCLHASDYHNTQSALMEIKSYDALKQKV